MRLPPTLVSVGEPVVTAAANVSGKLTITTPEPPAPAAPVSYAPPPPPPVFVVPATPAPGEEVAPEVEETPVQEQPQPEAAEPEVSEESEESKKLDALQKDMDTFRGEVKGIIQTEISNLTKTIKDAVQE